MKSKTAGYLFLFLLFIPISVQGEQLESFDLFNKMLPNHVESIEEVNTFLNEQEPDHEQEKTKLVKELINATDIEIENQSVINLLNQTTINSSRFAFGYSSRVYLGQWPLSYRSDETKVNWQYQKINTNQLDNRTGGKTERVHYDQLEEIHVKGGVQNPVSSSDQVMEMVLLSAKEHVDLPLAYHVVIGENTKLNTDHTVEINQVGTLDVHAAAVNEKGSLTYGEVYLELSGRKQKLVVKNITEQEVTVWIPIKDYVAFSYTAE